MNSVTITLIKLEAEIVVVMNSFLQVRKMNNRRRDHQCHISSVRAAQYRKCGSPTQNRRSSVPETSELQRAPTRLSRVRASVYPPSSSLKQSHNPSDLKGTRRQHTGNYKGSSSYRLGLQLRTNSPALRSPERSWWSPIQRGGIITTLLQSPASVT